MTFRGVPEGLRWRSLRALVPTVLGVLVVVAIVLAAVAVAREPLGVRPIDLLGDPGTGRGGRLAGVVGEFIVLGWTASAAVLLLASAARSPWRQVHRSLGILACALAVDDRFALHTVAGQHRRLFGLALLALPVVLALAIGLRHGRALVRHPDVALLILATGFLAASLAVDQTAISGRTSVQAIEESLKLLGAALWTVFAVRAALRVVRPATTAPGA